MKKYFFLLLYFFVLNASIYAKDEVQLDTTIIKGNKELPQILYLVPWKDIKNPRQKEQQIVLFSLFGDLFDPINPDESHLLSISDSKNQSKTGKSK